MRTSPLFPYRAASDVPYAGLGGETYLADEPLRALRKRRPLRVLSEEDFAFWQTFGYVVVKQAIPAAAARRLLDFVWNFQRLDPERPDSWYAEQEFGSELERDLYVYGFVPAYHHQLLWDSRQTERVYDAFVDVWDCEELWVSLDRLNLNPPNVRNRDRRLIPATGTGFDIELHWDVDTTSELAPLDRDPLRPDLDRARFPVIRPHLQAGDLLMFNGWLAHGVAPNTSRQEVRAVQYLAMMPALEANEELRQSRIDSWRYLATPTWNQTLLGDATRPESLRYGPAVLNERGRKLLGLDSWQQEGATCVESA